MDPWGGRAEGAGGRNIKKEKEGPGTGKGGGGGGGGGREGESYRLSVCFRVTLF
eukprot:COSAG03_NODE_23820_length_277_cov_0.410112_1_plen_53_part_01